MSRPVTVAGLLNRAFAALVVLLLFTGTAGIVASLLRGEVRDRSALPHVAMLTSQSILTVLAVLVAALTALRTTRRVTRPLSRLTTVLGRLGAGDHAARAPTDADLTEIREVARAVNVLADEADRVRTREAESARLAAIARDLGIRIRHHLSVEAMVEEAASGLGPMLDADHVVIRLAAEDGGRGTGSAWSRLEPTERRPYPTEPLAGLSPDWLIGDSGRDEDREYVYVWNDLDDRGQELPDEERAALRAAGARAVLSVGFHSGGGPSGAVTLIRCAVEACWLAQETRAAETVAGDLGRGLLHAQLYERERQLVAQLRDLDNAKSDFMSTVSHELRTPLTSIAGYLEMLSDGDAGELGETHRRMLAVIERNTTRLRNLVEDLLVLSRIEAGTLSTSRQEVEYSWLITTAVAATAPAAAAAGVTIETELSGTLIGRADPGQIDRVLMSLLSNAVKFTPRGGYVSVNAVRDDDDVVVRIADTGIGVPEAERHSLFTRFFRASNAIDQAVPGTGLGLAIVRAIVVRHGGRVEVESEEGKGTAITVRLPV